MKFRHLAILLIVVQTAAMPQTEVLPESENQPEHLTDEGIVALSRVIANPNAFVGKKIQVTGYLHKNAIGHMFLAFSKEHIEDKLWEETLIVLCPFQKQVDTLLKKFEDRPLIALLAGKVSKSEFGPQIQASFLEERTTKTQISAPDPIHNTSDPFYK